MWQKLSIFFVLLTMASKSFGICEHDYTRWKNFEADQEKWAKTSVMVMGGCSFLGALGGLFGAAPAAVAARFDKMAKDAKRDYENCLKEVTRKSEGERRKAVESSRRAEEQEQEVKEKTKHIDI